MATLVQAKGQITIPVEARHEMKLETGDRVVWVKNPEGRWEIWKVDDLLDSLDETFTHLPQFLKKAKRGFRPR